MFFRRFLLLTLFATIPLGASGAEPGVLTLAEALALTLRQNPELAVDRSELRAAQARIVQARLRPNPELSLQAENFTGSGGYKNGEAMEQTLQLSQLVELGGKREARLGEAKAGRNAAEWARQARRAEVLKTTAQAFVEVLFAQQQGELAEENTALAEQVALLTGKRVEAAKASTVEALRSRIAVASAKIEREQARRALATARGNLAAQWGAKTAAFARVAGNLDSLKKLPSLETLQRRIARHPELARWTAERERRAALLAQARAQARPDVTFSAGPRMIGKGSDLTAVAGISLPLPFWNRNQGAIAEARANVSKTGDERKAAEVRLFAELNEACQTLARAAAEVEALDREVLPSAKEAQEKIAEGYAAGRFSQLEILDSRRLLMTARSQKLRALADYHKAVAEIEALTAAPMPIELRSSPISNP